MNCNPGDLAVIVNNPFSENVPERVEEPAHELVPNFARLAQ